MHYRPVVVDPVIERRKCRVLVEIVFFAGLDVSEVDSHVGVSVQARLFVVEAYRMTDFVDGSPEATGARVGQPDALGAPDVPYVRITSAGRHEIYVVALCSTRHEEYADRVCPVPDRALYVLVGVRRRGFGK